MNERQYNRAEVKAETRKLEEDMVEVNRRAIMRYAHAPAYSQKPVDDIESNEGFSLRREQIQLMLKFRPARAVNLTLF